MSAALKVKELKNMGFAVTERRNDCTYMSRGADHRIVFNNGSVKRGQPEHRGSRR